MKKKLVLMTSALMAISLLAGCGHEHVHNYGEVIYEWSADYTSCTATRVCKDDESHVDTETVKSTYKVVLEAKCEVDGKGRYTADFTNEAFADQTKDITLEAIGHKWGEVTYTWADDYSSCTAMRVCLNDENHIDTETAFSAYTVILPPTCLEEGTGVYDVAFEKEYFKAQSHEVTLPISGHTLTHHEAKEATRLEDGNIEYWSCDVCEKYFSDEEGKNEIDAESIIIPALGTDKTYFNGTYWRDSSFTYTLSFGANNFSDYHIYCEYYFSSFDYNDETKILSFILTRVESFGEEPSPYEIGDTISFTFDAEKDVLMFGTIVLSKMQS